MPGSKTIVRSSATAAFRWAPLRNGALRLAGKRRRALVLLYHRVGPEGPSPHEVVPTVPASLFRRHIEALAEVGDIVSAADIAESDPTSRRPRFAVTFDDDHRSQIESALPTLRDLGASATFFLSGRSLHGLGPYWWERLEGLIRDEGLEPTRSRFGLGGETPSALAAECQGTQHAAALEALESTTHPPPDREQIASLIAHGMDVGFHTLRHPDLTLLADDEVAAHLGEGLGALGEVVGRPVTLFAYPHGLADRRVAALVRDAGFRAAFAAQGRPISPASDRFLLGRWEPGGLEIDEFVAGVAARLLRRPIG